MEFEQVRDIIVETLGCDAEQGLDSKFKITKDDEINHINQIFESYGISIVFGWHQLNLSLIHS